MLVNLLIVNVQEDNDNEGMTTAVSELDTTISEVNGLANELNGKIKSIKEDWDRTTRF